MMRGFFSVAMVGTKDNANVGAAFRAAHCFGASQFILESPRKKAVKAATNVTHAHKHIPTFICDDLFNHRPHDTEVVIVELIEGAMPITDFKHPERALYVFGPEDGSLGARHSTRAHHTIYIPTAFCLNLAATVNVVLFDRANKRNEWKGNNQ